jgi:hypothetical protein
VIDPLFIVPHTYEEAADLFLSTQTGKSAGVSRDAMIALLKSRFPDPADLAEWWRGAGAKYMAMVAAAGHSAQAAAAGYRLCAGGTAIECLTCGRVSYNAGDVREKYCGNCHKFHPKPH